MGLLYLSQEKSPKQLGLSLVTLSKMCLCVLSVCVYYNIKLRFCQSVPVFPKCVDIYGYRPVLSHSLTGYTYCK
jgi:hypothetical protein